MSHPSHPFRGSNPGVEADSTRLLRQIIEWNQTTREYPRDATIHQLFSLQAQRHPEAVVLVDGDRKLTYGELHAWSNQLARYLIRHGVQADTPVAVCIYRSVEMVVALLGILKAGGAYVPLDPAYPRETLAFMLADAAPDLLLTDGEAAGMLPEADLRVISLSARESEITRENADDLEERTSAQGLAYVSYTSGSTGQPKGVAVPHRGVVRLVIGADYVDISQADTFLQLAPLAFDASTFELWAPLLTGARCVLYTGCIPVPQQIGELICAHGVSILWLTSSLFNTIIDEAPQTLIGVKQLLVGGEALSVRHVRRAQQLLPGTQLINGYGPTENTTFTCCYRIPHGVGDDAESIPIGRPIANTTAYILDEELKPVALGEVGELYTGGDGLARGYLNQPELTAERFIADPFSLKGGARLYKTGDRVRYLSDGAIEFLGRLDGQVKLNGFRIELGEIETVASRHPGVQNCVVVMSQAPSGQKRLVCYFVPSPEAGLAPEVLREYLRERLPAHMVPALLLPLERLPLTANGKLDRNALPNPAPSRAAACPIPAANGLEETILCFWQEIVGVDGISVEDNFFDCGGKSLDLIRLHARLCQHLNRSMPVTDLFQYPTVRNLARHLNVDLPTAADAEHRTGRELLRRGRAFPRPGGGPQQAAEHAGGTSPRDAAVPAYDGACDASLSLPGREPYAAEPGPEAQSKAIIADELMNAIAIVGMAGQFPGARDLQEFWHNLRSGVESISVLSDEELEAAGIDPQVAADASYVRARAILSDVDRFDAEFFGINAREAALMDPQHRVFLEKAWEALEHGGYDPQAYRGAIGLYAGLSMNTYLLWNLCASRDFIGKVVPDHQLGSFQTLLGNDKDFLPTRVAYKLNLRGPSMTVQTACSTSLVAVAQACQSLLSFGCDMALAGGISISNPQHRGYAYVEGGMGSPDGHCRPFDASAQGTVFGSGVGVVLLKRLEDALADGDTVHAVIRGIAVNNDGSGKVSYTAPSVDGQAEVVRTAQALAGVSPESITYIEAHGTATPLGDPIEVAALTQAFRSGTDRRNFCALGAVKGNVGHLEAAAGVTGLLKTVLALKHREIPPTLHFRRPNPKLELESSPFYVNAQLQEWPAGETPRRAGVSSFGVGGTNAHAVLEEAPEPQPTSAGRPWQLLTLSARSEAAADSAVQRLLAHLKNDPEVDSADAAYTLHVGRHAFSHRRVVLCESAIDAVAALENADRQRFFVGNAGQSDTSVVFMFPGQGSQYVRMGQELYEAEPTFRAAVDQCCTILQPLLGLDLRDVLFPLAGQEEAARARLNQTYVTQPALFTIQYALAQLWLEWGVRPRAMVGHSIGEYTAACLAGVFSLEDALSLLAARAKMMQELPGGSMLAVRLTEAELLPLLAGELSLAAINGPQLCVAAGPVEAVEALKARLAEQGVAARLLHTSHAFHSGMMDPITEPFFRRVAQVSLNAPQIPYLSGVTGTWITAAEATSPEYWKRHFREPVRFADMAAELLRQPDTALLEVGPGRTLSTLVRQMGGVAGGRTIANSLRHADESYGDTFQILQALGRLWLAGAPVDWAGFHTHEMRRRVPLPTYPFARERYWVDAPRSAQRETHPPEITIAHSSTIQNQNPGVLIVNHPSPVTPQSTRKTRILRRLREMLHDMAGIQIAEGDAQVTFVELGLDSLFLTQASVAFQKEFKLKVTFRQLMGELATLGALAAFLDEKLPDDQFTEAPAMIPEAAPVTLPAPTPPNRTLAGAPSLSAPAPVPPPEGYGGNTGVEQLLAQQLQLMDQQLQLLRGALISKPVAPAAMSHPAAPTAVPVVPLASAAPLAPSKADKEKAEFKAFGPYKPINRVRGGGLTQKQQAYLDALIQRYTSRTAESKRQTQAHRAHHADPRVVSGFRAQWKEMVYPIIVERSAGSRLWDVDGNEYVDILNGFGLTMFGHSPDFVTEAVEAQIRKGVEIGPQTPQAGEVAKLICELTGMDRACFCNTGSEAVMAAIRVARTVTARDKIVTFAGAYHGTFDEVLVRANAIDGKLYPAPIAPGIPQAKVDNVYVLEYGTPESLEFIREHADELAAVLVETVQSRRPDVQPKEFLREVRRITEQSGTALIFDEVVTGFRVHPGGVQALFGIRADMATYGKVIGGGYPVGVLAGRAQYMDALDGGMWAYGDDSLPEVGVTFHAGTFVRHPLAMAATHAVLSHLKASGPALQAGLNEKADRFCATLNAFFMERSVPTRIRNFGSILYFKFPEDLQFTSLFYYNLRLRGVHILEGFPCFITTAHTDADLELVTRAFKETVLEMQEVGFLPCPDAPEGTSADSATDIQSPDGVLATADPGAGGAPRTVRAPLTEAQREIWLSAQMGDDASCAYNESCTVHLRGPLCVETLQKSLQALVDRHEALRARFAPNGEFQEFLPELRIETPFLDLSDDPARGERIEEIVTGEASRAFDLHEGPLFRARILKLEPERFQLIMTVHHLVCDGWSIGVLLKDLGQIYATIRSGGVTPAGPEMQFAQYALHQERQAQSEETAAAEAYWLSQFEQPAPPLELPGDRPRPPMKTYSGSMVRHTLRGGLLEELKRTSAQRGHTLFSTMLAAFKLLLFQLSGEGDLVIGVPAAGQLIVNSPDLVGHCLNFLPLRSQATGSLSFSDYLSRIKELVLDAYEHQNYTYGTLIRKLHLPRDTSRLPLLSVMFNLDPGGMDQHDFAGVQAEVFSNPKSFTNVELFLNIFPANDELRLECDYNTDLFDRETVQRWLGHYQTLLEQIIANPDRPLGEISLLTGAERHQILVDWNATEQPYRSDHTIHQLFEAQVERTPDATALVSERERLTYRELNARANQLARYLGALGVGPETMVGVCLERGAELVVSLLGILKAGGAYVPLDPNYPPQRLQFILEDTQAPVIVTQSSMLTALPAHQARTVCVDRDTAAIGGLETTNLPAMSRAADLAYIIYTSGSTGRPKGVAIEHRNAAALVDWAGTVFTPEEVAGVLFSTSICFDLSVFELFVTLSLGGKVIVAQNGLQLPTLPAREEVTLVNTVPSVMTELLRSHTLPSSVRTVNLAGELLPTSLVNEIYQQPDVERVYDLYGPSEDTTYSTYTLRRPHEPATIGRPISNTRTYVVDANLQPVPIGVPGELYVGGAGLARCYLNQPELTAEKFIADPFRGTRNDRIYRTGDLVRYLADGEIEFLGRVDHQVKVRGFRIELGEIEAIINDHPAVRECVVAVRDDEAGMKRLAAYVVPTMVRDGAAVNGASGEMVTYWQKHWDMLFGSAISEIGDASTSVEDVDIVVNRWTNQENLADQTAEWIQQTVERIQSLRPRRVLEIGCGGGQLLSRLAPHCEAYFATDLSRSALDIVRGQVEKHPEWPKVELLQASADDFHGIPTGHFDVVVINSVSQYFPNVDYLLRVIAGAALCATPDGHIFVGDVQSFPLMETYHLEAQLARADGSLPVEQFRQRVQKRLTAESELTLDPALFHALKQQMEVVGQVEIQLRKGRLLNETTQYHYDVVLSLGEKTPTAQVPEWHNWDTERLSLVSLCELLKQGREIVGVRDIPNARLRQAAWLQQQVSESGPGVTVADLRQGLEAVAHGVQPDDVWKVAEESDYTAHLRWSGSGVDGRMHAVFVKNGPEKVIPAFPDDERPLRPWNAYANQPSIAPAALPQLGAELRQFLEERIPDYMIPSAFVTLPALPLTPNGKLNRRALPAPEWHSAANREYVAPVTATQRLLADIWGRVLRLERVSIEDSIFDLGGDSLLIFQITTRALEAGLEVTPRQMFQHRTIAALSAAMAEEQPAERRQAPAISRVSRDAHRVKRSSL